MPDPISKKQGLHTLSADNSRESAEENKAGRKEELRRVGLKVTLPRIEILEIMEGSSERHLSAEDIYQKLVASHIDIGLATVYRVLTQFETANLVTRHNFEGGHSVFELNQGEHHDHLVCLRCGYVEEFIDPVIEERQQLIAEKADFKMTDHALNIYGLCKQCRKKSPL